jgi:hypothetical protein
VSELRMRRREYSSTTSTMSLVSFETSCMRVVWVPAAGVVPRAAFMGTSFRSAAVSGSTAGLRPVKRMLHAVLLTGAGGSSAFGCSHARNRCVPAAAARAGVGRGDRRGPLP